MKKLHDIFQISSDELRNPDFVKPYVENSLEERLEEDLFETVTKKPLRKLSQPNAIEVFFKKMAVKLKNYSDQPASDEEIEERLGKMYDFMRRIYLKGVRTSTLYSILYSIYR